MARRRSGIVLRIPSAPRLRWFLAAVLGIPLVVVAALGGYYAVTFSELIEERLHGERDRVLPRVFARPVELWRGQAMSRNQLIERLNDLGYAERARALHPGEFAAARDSIVLIPSTGDDRGHRVVVRLQQPPVAKVADSGSRILVIPDLEVSGKRASRVTLGTPMLTALMRTGRAKRRQVPLEKIPERAVQAVLAIEDR
ncbi:MAG TPA: hypothetical protein VNK41_11540, partial [Vicinamibacterales bacterium]|nr:hypothetical protein [Vicinamibacterales bacterium]